MQSTLQALTQFAATQDNTELQQLAETIKLANTLISNEVLKGNQYITNSWETTDSCRLTLLAKAMEPPL